MEERKDIIAPSHVGDKYSVKLLVSPSDTALAIGSGDLEVLATPRMMALMEEAAMKCVAPLLNADTTTVGGHIESSHLRPTKTGNTVEATATLTKVEGRKLSFEIVATQDGEIIGKGTHLRFAVNREKFMK